MASALGIQSAQRHATRSYTTLIIIIIIITLLFSYIS